jgi:hypothetical protein
MNDNQWLDELLAKAPTVPPSGPRAYYDEDGDCIEFLFSNESYYAERYDPILTVYYGQESGEVVGSLIKCVRRFIHAILKDYPGFVVDIEDGKVRLEHLLTAGMWQNDSNDKPAIETYKQLREAAYQHRVEVMVPELLAN